MSKRLEAWCFKGADGWGHDICFQRGGGRAIRLGECAESETVVSRAELRALRAEVRRLREQQAAVAMLEEGAKLRERMKTAEANNRTLREALEVFMRRETAWMQADGPWSPDLFNAARAALALQPGDALRAFATKLCEAQREATARYLARADVAWDELWSVEQEAESAPLVVDDVLGKAGE